MHFMVIWRNASHARLTGMEIGVLFFLSITDVNKAVGFLLDTD